MAAGPIRGGFRPPANQPNSTTTHRNEFNVELEAGRRKTSVTTRESKLYRSTPYARPLNSYSFKKTSLAEGLLETLSGAVKKVFSLIYQTESSASEKESKVMYREEPMKQVDLAVSNPVVDRSLIEPSPHSVVIDHGNPTDLLSDLILNPLYKQSRSSTYKQIGRFFQAKGVGRLSQYEYDQMSAIIRRLSCGPVVVQQGFKYPLSSGAAASTTLLHHESPMKMEESVNILQKPSTFQTIVIEPSRVFNAMVDYEEDIDMMSTMGSDHAIDEPVVSNKILIPVPVEPKLRIQSVPQSIRLPLKPSTADSATLASNNTLTDFKPSQSVDIAPVQQTQLTLPPQEQPLPPKKLSEFIVPDLKPILESDIKVDVPKNLKFDFGQAIIPPEPKAQIEEKKKKEKKEKDDEAAIKTGTEKATQPTGFTFMPMDSQSKVQSDAKPFGHTESAKTTFPSFAATSASPNEPTKFSFGKLEEPKKETTKFVFGQGKKKEDDNGDDGNNKSPTLMTTSDTIKPITFAIDEKDNQTSEQAIKKPFSFNMQASQPFSFGMPKPTEPQKTDAPQQLSFSVFAQNDTQGQSLFSALSKPSEDTKEQQQRPLFSFGTSKPFEQPTAMPPTTNVFSFGDAHKKEDSNHNGNNNNDNNSDHHQQKASTGDSQASTTNEAKMKPFTFGQSPLTFGDSKPTAPFSFGAPQTSTSMASLSPFGALNEQKPTFIFGSPAVNPPAATSQFSFSQPLNQSSNSFSFSQPSTTDHHHQQQLPSSQPLFTFGGSPTTASHQPPSAPFVFGQSSAGQSQSFNMGSSPSSATSDRKKSNPISRRKIPK